MMLAAQLPSWANSDNLQWIALGVIGLMVVLMFLVFRFIQKMTLKLIFFGIFAIIGLIAWTQREDLEDCAKTCDCKVLGYDVKIPQDKIPADATADCVVAT
jgi:hypothetical protein